MAASVVSIPVIKSDSYCVENGAILFYDRFSFFASQKNGNHHYWVLDCRLIIKNELNYFLYAQRL